MNYKEYRECIKIEIGRGFKNYIRSRFEASKNAVYMIRKSQLLYSKGGLFKLISKIWPFSNDMEIKSKR